MNTTGPQHGAALVRTLTRGVSAANDAAVAAYVERMVAAAPTLTAHQAGRLQALLGCAPTAPRRAQVAA